MPFKLFFGNKATGTVAADYRLEALPGVVTLAGQNVTLTKTTSYALQALSGTVTLAGQNVTLTKTTPHMLTALPGVVTLSGKNVELRYSIKYRLNVLPGAVVLSGQNVELRPPSAGYKLDALPGGIVLGGQPIVLRRGRSLTLETGAITVAGTPATFIRHHIMRAGRGDFEVSRLSVGLAGPTVQPGKITMGYTVYLPNRW